MSLTKVSYSMIAGAPINVLDYGADPTGVSDSTAAIQAAIDYAQSLTYGTVFFPKGTYKTSASLVVHNPISFIGDGSTATVIQPTSALTDSCLKWGVDGVTPRPGYGVVIEKMSFDGSNVTTPACSGISMWASHTEIKDCKIFGFTGSGIDAVDSWSNIVHHCWIHGNNANGITLSGACNIFVIKDNYLLSNGGDGIYVTGGNKVVIDSNDIEGNLKNGVALENFGVVAMRSISIINNYFEANNASNGGYYGIYDNRNGNEISNLNISYNYFETALESACIATQATNDAYFNDNQNAGPAPLWLALNPEGNNVTTFNNSPVDTTYVNNLTYSNFITTTPSDGFVVNGRLARLALETQEVLTKGTLWSVAGRYSASPFPTITVGTTTQTYGSAAPVSGAQTLGSIVWNTSPTAGGNVGWICVSAGTPGTWKTFGAIAS